MYKKILSYFMCFVIVFSVFTVIPVNVSARQTKDFKYDIWTDGTAKVTQYIGDDLDVVIPSSLDGYKVTIIGKRAFYEQNIHSVSIPDTVRIIEEEAFLRCNGLVNVDLDYNYFTHEGVETIGSNAFTIIGTPFVGNRYIYRNEAFNSVLIPPSVKTIGICAFGYRYLKENSWSSSYDYHDFYEMSITGYNNTAAQTYANANPAIDFISLGEVPNQPTEPPTDPPVKQISECNISLNPTEFTYDGTEKQPTVVVTDGSTVLSYGKDYTLAYFNNKEAGTASVMVIGIGNYTGTVTKNFTIKAPVVYSLTDCTIMLGQTSYAYDGTEKKPTVTVKDGSKTLTLGTDYTISYSDNTNVGNATATITGKGNYMGEVTKTFSITAKSISSATVMLSKTSFTYNGSAQKPTVTVKDGTNTLLLDTDYAITYANNTNAGSATATITGKGNYTGTVSKTFNITAKSISSATVTLSKTTYAYDGTAKQPTVTVTDGAKVLTAGTDYIVSYSNNKNVGTATVTVTGKSNYTGSVSRNFTITEDIKPDIADSTITLSQISYTYDGNAKQPTVTVKYGSKTLTKGTDYTVSYSNNIGAGTGSVTVTGTGSYVGTVTKNFTIGAKSIVDATLSLSQSSYTYDGSAKKPTATVKDGSLTLKSGTDYSMAYTDNVNAGTATVTVTGKGNYTGSVTKSFSIGAKSISSATVTLSTTSYTYDGTAKKPTVTVKDGTLSLVNGSAYYVSYENNINAGTAKAVITGIGNYTGTITKAFTIKEAPKINLSTCTVSLSQQSYNYDGTQKKPTVTVKHEAKALTEGTDYTVTYSNNIKVGTATATVTGIGSYTGTVTKQFTIINTKPEFTWEQDNWNFLNSSWNGYFKDSTYREQINTSYLNSLKNNLTNTEFQIINGGYYANYSWLDEDWGGSCYGMSSLALLSKLGVLPYADYKAGATKLHDLDYPKSDSNVSSLVTYYQMLQIKDVIQQQYRTVPYRSNETNIKEIISLLDANPTVLVCFDKYGWGGHAILATGYEYGSYTWSGVTYQGCIKICDPNCSMEYNKKYNIYFNTQSYNWIIPAYSEITSVNGAEFSYVGANAAEINEGGYLNGVSGNKTGEFVARIDADKIANNRSVTKVKKSNGSYVNMATAPGDIIEDYSYVFGGESKGKIGYNLFDSSASYRVTQDNAQELQLGMDYQLCNLYGSSKAGQNILFDPSGYVEVNGETASYNIAMTFDENYPTDWFNIEVSGEGAKTASLQKAQNGYILKSDSMENVFISVNNKDAFATLSFSTDYDTVFIYEIDENTVGVLVDTDYNGTYDSNLFETHGIKRMFLGDVDGDGEVSVVDSTYIQRYNVHIQIPIGEDTLIKCGDIDGDGEVTVLDATFVQRYDSKIPTPYPIGEPI